jgi:hypothetical protein
MHLLILEIIDPELTSISGSGMPGGLHAARSIRMSVLDWKAGLSSGLSDEKHLC